MNWKDRITVNPEQCAGRPCIRGMRIRVSDILGLLAAGLTQNMVLEELPDLESGDIEAALKDRDKWVWVFFWPIWCHPPSCSFPSRPLFLNWVCLTHAGR